jgi:hypothetical protein
MNDKNYLKALHEALASETDPERFAALLVQLDRFIDDQVRRARSVPDVEQRSTSRRGT